eukprot:9560824-Alexandrium_andersonii.AAC.1
MFGVSCSSNIGSSIGKFKTAPGARSLNCAGPDTASKSLPTAPEGWTKRPGGRAGGVFAELLEQRTPTFRRCLNSQLRNTE